MKRLFSFLVLMVACSFSFATVRTLCNMSYCAGTYSTYADAQASSSNGDTIYVQGSTIDYGTIEITKSLVIIGTGHNPDKQNPLVSRFVGILISANNVQLIGLRLQQTGTTLGAVNCVIKKCRLTVSSGQAIIMNGTSGWLIEGNIIEILGANTTAIHFNFGPSNNTIVQNNVIMGQGVKIVALSNSSIQRTYFINNVFLGPAGGNVTFAGMVNCSVDNNIFYNSSPDGGTMNIDFSTMNNNISYGVGDLSFSQIGTNNLPGINPMFTTYPGPQTFFDYNWDLSLQAASAGHNTGTDFTDRGVYGGVGNKFTETGEPSIAEITAFSITSPTIIPPGGGLTISVTSKVVH